MAGALRSELPEVTGAVREAYSGCTAHIGDKQIGMDGIYTDTGFFSMMSFPALEGDPEHALQDPQSVLLTQSAAKKLFGDSAALGRTFIIDDSVPVRVGAVLRDVPVNSTIQFEYIRPFAAFEPQSPWLKKWDDNRILTWLQLRPGADITVFDRKATAMLQTRSNDTTVSTFAMPMARLRLHSGFDNGKQSGGKIYIVMLMVILGFFVLVIACINFMNIATARSEMRAREVGVRKVMGASRRQIMMQFFCEALTIVLLSLFAGLLVSRAVLPLFNRYMDTNIHIDLLNWWVWAGVLGIGLLTGAIAGSYPALFLSRFLPAKVLKGVVTKGKKAAFFRRALVTTQFWLAIIFIIATIVVWQEIKYVEDRPLGYDQQNLIDVRTSAELGSKYPLFLHQLSRLPGIKNVSAGSDNLLRFGGAITGLDWPGKVPGHEISILVTNVGYNWIRTAGLSLVQGRDFDAAFGTDTSACLVNESTVQRLGLKEPVLGQKLGGSTIIGVVRNFVFNNPSGIIAPMAIYLYKGVPGGNGHFFVRIANDDHWRQTIASIGKVVKELDPRHGFNYSFTREDYQSRFEELTAYGVLATIFGGMAIFISCLGLIGLAAFVAERRSKEMSIRKVFGASVRQVLLLLSSDFLRPVFIAFLLAVPAAAWAMKLWLNNITYHISLSWTVFAAGGAITFLIALATVGLQGLRTANENPAKKLRNE
jgi:ABC-type antimicrobial peptide transport system permease subunit